MLDWMMRAAIVGGIATTAAWLFEQAFRNARVGTRHAWTFALLATTLLPVIPRLTPESPVSEVVPAITLPVITISGDATATSGLDVVLLVWVILSGIVLLAYLVSYLKLQHARRTWRKTHLADDEVFLSDRFGPAIFGFIAPSIVVPEWVRTTSHEEQKLIVLHEREHIRARDHLQLLLTIIATIAMPWNPFVWIQARRLRFALEADCDQRVLAAIPDHERYATLLVDVGSRQMGLLLTPALAEHRNGLERRIVMLANTVIRNRWKAAAMLVLGLGATVVACESRLPQEPQPMREAARVEVSEMKEPFVGLVATESKMGELIGKHYPPLLRDAGIGGTVRIRAKAIANGKLVGAELVGTSGHEALDEAGLRVANEMEYEHDLTADLEMALEFNPNRRVRMGVDLAPLQPTRSLPRKMSSEPSFTPYTKKPELQNRDEVASRLARYYPASLREAGIGGTTLLWVLLDETGRVMETKVKETSGHPEIDAGAQQVAKVMRFSPARNGEEAVPVWIALPVVMTAK